MKAGVLKMSGKLQQSIRLLLLVSLISAMLSGNLFAKTAQEIEAPQYDKPLPPGAHALRKITDPDMIPKYFNMVQIDFIRI